MHNTEKLKLELDKYRQWEISTEIELKRKVISGYILYIYSFSMLNELKFNYANAFVT